MINRFVAPVRKHLLHLSHPLVFVDIGARNGTLELEAVADFVRVYGFEPNPAEYEKLVQGKTDAALIAGIVAPRYRHLTYSPYAIYSHCGQHRFYITSGPGSCGLTEPDFTRLREIKWKGRRYQANLGDDIFRVVKILPVEVRTLDWFCTENKLEYIDYLKIDVEGAEYEVLEGASGILSKVGVIRSEVCFIPFRKNQKLFSDVDLLLRRHGFDLLRYEIDPVQVGYKTREFPFTYGPSLGFADPAGQPLMCDAIYVNRAVTEPERLLSQAAVLIDKNYLDEALFILGQKLKLDDSEFLAALHDYQGKLSHRAARAVAAMWRWAKQRLAG
jgi:FkbM family methyltransferase